MRKLTDILRCQRGATAIEYALVASIISVAALVGIIIADCERVRHCGFRMPFAA